MDKEIDILSIDVEIKNNFKKETEKLVKYKEMYLDIKKSMELENIKNREKSNLAVAEKDLKKHIDDTENNVSLNFYIIESAILLEKYKDILKEPLKITFSGKTVKNNKEKEAIIKEYLEIAGKYVNIEITCERKDKITCKNCSNKKNFDIVDTNIYICCVCSVQQIVLKNMSSYRDINRINISSKYCYDRKVHFKDCINQYQGKTLLQIFFATLCIFRLYSVNYIFLNL